VVLNWMLHTFDTISPYQLASSYIGKKEGLITWAVESTSSYYCREGRCDHFFIKGIDQNKDQRRFKIFKTKINGKPNGLYGIWEYHEA